ncbi:HEAT repeat domain-containing protein [Sphingobacterium anhuiense]|uniref:HEAT repeat domain-containing protein n=1 Tax=Sphingobacterium anhuiense TaxID=493780 RepID=UPI003C3041DC
MYYDYYLYYLSSLYNGYPLIIRVTVVMVMLFALIAFFGICRLFFTGYKINIAARRKDSVIKEYREKLHFIMNTDKNYDVHELDELLACNLKTNKPWKFELFTELILEVRDALEVKKTLNLINYKNCLETLKLMTFWEKRLRTSELMVRKNALQTVGLLNNGLNTGLISKSVFHKNKHLRKAARNVHTDLDSYNPFRFMEDNFDESFTKLDKIRLHATLVKRYNEGRLPNLLRWINSSKNSNYISFIIQEVGFFGQYEACPDLLAMLDRQENKDVRIQLIHTLGTLAYGPAIENLKQRYELESTPVREAIVISMGAMKGDDALQFLLETYERTYDDSLKIMIARSIKKHGSMGEENLLMLQNKANESEKIIIRQVFAEQLIKA